MRLIDAAIACGEWPSDTVADLHARLILVTLHGLIAEWHLRPGAFSWEEMAGRGGPSGWHIRWTRVKQRRVDSWWAQLTCAGGTCAPPVTPPGNPIERGMDTYTSMTAPFLRGFYVFLTVAVVWFVSRALGSPVGLVVEGAFFLIFGTCCLANFARCQEAHCIVTGLG